MKVDAEAEPSVRQRQRRSADHVGLSPKAVICRHRLYDVDRAAPAAELGYSDQDHLTPDVSATAGMPPDRYARTGGLAR